MYKRNNLSPDFGSRYYEVVTPFTVLCPRRAYLSGTYIETAQAYGWIFDLVRLRPGDQVHDTPLGVLILQAGEPCVPARISTSMAELLALDQSSYEEWPLDCLIELPECEPVEAQTFIEVAEPVGTKVGSSIDYVDCPSEAVVIREGRLYPKERSGQNG